MNKKLASTSETARETYAPQNIRHDGAASLHVTAKIQQLSNAGKLPKNSPNFNIKSAIASLEHKAFVMYLFITCTIFCKIPHAVLDHANLRGSVIAHNNTRSKIIAKLHKENRK